MVSNVLLAFIHLRLCEIFDTLDESDGWFGRVNILVFGDLLQLAPVNEEPPYIEINPQKASKFFNSLNLKSFGVWKDIFSYDELTINMRQQSDQLQKMQKF